MKVNFIVNQISPKTLLNIYQENNISVFTNILYENGGRKNKIQNRHND